MISITEFFRKKTNLPRNDRYSRQAGGRRQQKNTLWTALTLLVGGVTAGQRADSCGGGEQNKTNRGVIV